MILRTVTMLQVLVFAALSGCVSREVKPEDLVGLSKNEVRERLGGPVAEHKTDWALPRQDATPEEAERFYNTTVGSGWEYDGFTVIFNTRGIVIRVEPEARD